MVGFIPLILTLQAAQATITGNVRDADNGLPLVGATVSLPGVNRSTTTTADGKYVLTGIAQGVQPMVVRYMGHLPHDIRVLVPETGLVEINVMMVSVPLQLAPIDVRSQANRLPYPDKRAIGGGVKNHPLLSEPDVLLALTGGEVVIAPETPNGVHVRGGSADQTAYTLDGIPIFNPIHANGTFGALNPDALLDVTLISAVSDGFATSGLSGAISATTRSPGSSHQARGSVSVTQSRATIDGPLGGGGYLVSLRSAFPGFVAPDREMSYVRGDIGDWMAKFETPLAGGRLALLGFESEDEVTTSAQVTGTNAAASLQRNDFGWQSRSLGARWTGDIQGTSVHVVTWSATGAASATWNGEQVTRRELKANRSDVGIETMFEHRTTAVTSRIGARLERMETQYAASGGDQSGDAFVLQSASPIVSVYGQTQIAFTDRIAVDLGSIISRFDGTVFPSPHASVRWNPVSDVTVSGSYRRSYQFVQSLRNPESPVGFIFPAELFVRAGRGGIPVARSDQLIFAADYQPSDVTHLGAQLYTRSLHNIVLPAVTTAGPFATNDVPAGSGTVLGGSVDASLTTARLVGIASYGFQTVKLRHGSMTYTPQYSAPHRVEAGVTFLPRASMAIRAGVSSIFGRRTTPIVGGFEWEACNLGDRGCEFAGSPDADVNHLGSMLLPSYTRLDIGARKEWSIPVASRTISVALFGTFTNILGRANVLTYVSDVSAGEPGIIEMRPRAPLVIGLDWRF